MFKISSFTICSFLVYLFILTGIILPAKNSQAITHPIWNPTGNIDSLKTLVNDYVGLSNTQLRNKLDNNGNNNPINAEMVFITYDLALLYHLTQDTGYADKAAVLLARYYEVFPQWPLDYSDNRGHFMWWDNWFHRDLGEVAFFLPLAYDLIVNSGCFEKISPDTRQKVLSLFKQIVQVDLGYKLYFFNAAGTRPLGLMVFGRILEDPELVHLGYWYYNRLIHEMFYYDGFWHEGTYDYGFSIVKDISMPEYAFYCDGYSDPAGYVHIPFDPTWDPQRLDNLDFKATFGDIYTRIKNSLWHTSLPDRNWPVLNETFSYPNGYNSVKYRPNRMPMANSMLLAGLGHAALTYGSGTEQTQARFDFSPAISHCHNDALHLIYYDKGLEVVGGTGYTEGDRAWNISTLNQNLVVVNGMEQNHGTWNDQTSSPYIPGTGRINGLPTKVPFPDTNLHNNIILFEPGFQSFRDVQVTEVDAQTAYADAGVTRYRRVLALVNISANDVYLVDFFRLQGGTQYDWCIHGGHDNYNLTTNLNLKSASGTFGNITIKEKAAINNNWYGEFTYSGATHRFTVCGSPSTTVYAGKALQAVKDGGLQDYVLARRMTNSITDENFLVVHETYTSTPQILSVEKLTFADNGSAIGVKVSLANGLVDYIIHTLDDGPNFPEHKINGSNIVMQGKFAHIRYAGNDIQWLYLAQGKSLKVNSVALESNNNEYSIRGSVTRVNRIEDGAAENSFVVNTSLPEATLAGKTIILTWANGWNWAYTIKEVRGNTIITDDEPGFTLNGNTINMRHFPAGQYQGPVTFIIPGVALLNNNGEMLSTEFIISADKTPPAPPVIRGIRKEK